MTPGDEVFGSVAWAARLRAREAQRTPSEVSADIAWMDEWMESLPVLPLLEGQEVVVVIFNPTRKGGSQ